MFQGRLCFLEAFINVFGEKGDVTKLRHRNVYGKLVESYEDIRFGRRTQSQN